ncbi:hypothetical protein AB1L42_19325 [Thalassoglobus sp. JC818]|uniref:hypothetical protein n=1 Tax=Thalassoglobus sp. JC818 TaxID=3232136 RepID=UPI00345938D1
MRALKTLAAFLLLAGSVQAQTTLYSDNFTTEATIDIDAWDSVENGGVWWNDATDATPWTAVSGTKPTVNAFSDRVNGGNTIGHSLIDLGTANVDWTLTHFFNGTSDDTYDSVFWIRSNSDRTQALGIFHDSSEGEFSLVDQDMTEIEPGEATGMSVSTDHTIRIVLDGSSITVYIDGGETPVADWTNATGQTNTYLGLRTNRSTVRFDDFSIVSIPEPEEDDDRRRYNIQTRFAP